MATPTFTIHRCRRKSIPRAWVILGLLLAVFPAAAADYRVLVVMSYEEDNPWCGEILQGIESVLGARASLSYRYMDTKRDIDGGPGRAAEIYREFQDLAPDGVIAVDDNAQAMFVVPYLLGRHATPVMFSGVNAEPSKYGFPNATVSGIIERGHIAEAVAFAHQLTPSVQRLVVMSRDSPSGRALLEQVATERDRYLLPLVDTLLANRLTEIQDYLAAAATPQTLLYIDSLEGIKDAGGTALSNRQVLDGIYEVFDGHVAAANRYQVADGAMSAVVNTGFEQGATAAEMLLQALTGTPVAEIPVRRNYQGRRYINANRVDAMGLTLDPVLLRTAKVVSTAPSR